MQKFLPLALAAVALAAQPHFARADVTWNFYETGTCIPVNGACTATPSFPIASLTLPGPTSSGSATYSAPPPPSASATLTGDPFAFTLVTGENISPMTDYGATLGGPRTIVTYDISWDEVDGVFDALSIFVLSFTDEFAWNGTAGPSGPRLALIGSDGIFPGCSTLGVCDVSVWVNASEPTSAALLLTGLLVTWAVSLACRSLAG